MDKIGEMVDALFSNSAETGQALRDFEGLSHRQQADVMRAAYREMLSGDDLSEQAILAALAMRLRPNDPARVELFQHIAAGVLAAIRKGHGHSKTLPPLCVWRAIADIHAPAIPSASASTPPWPAAANGGAPMPHGLAQF